jgi:hypothetical protein
MLIAIRQSFRLLYRNLQSTFLVSKILDNALRFLWIVPKSGAKSFLLRLKSQLVWHQRQRYLLNAPTLYNTFNLFGSCHKLCNFVGQK